MRAKTAQLSWPLPEGLNDDALEALLFPVVAKSTEARPMPDWARVHLELRRKHVTLMLLWEEYRERYPDGYGYTQFCEHYRRFAKRVDVVMRFTHKAGERMFVDFAGSTIPLYDEARRHVVAQAEVFVSALGASSLIYAEAMKSQSSSTGSPPTTTPFPTTGACPSWWCRITWRAGSPSPVATSRA